MEKEFTCCFTGHRIIPENREDQIRCVLRIHIKNLIEDKGVTDFIAGGALGFDTIAAETVIDLKKDYPFIKLHLYLPCFDQSAKWSMVDRYKWRMMMVKVDDYAYITESKYTPDCMQKRNRRMVDDSCYCIAYCVKQNSGTGTTVRHAELTGTVVYNIAEIICE